MLKIPFSHSLKVAFFLTLKSITRSHPSVTVLIIAMLMLSNLNLMFVPSLMQGVTNSANQKMLDTYSSSIIIEPGGDLPVIHRVNELVSRLEATPGVVAVTYRNAIGAKLEHDEERVSCTVRAVIPERDMEVFGIAEAIIEGSYLEPRDRDQIVLGLQLSGSGRTNIELYSSSLKKVHAGDRISVRYSNGLEKNYRVKGIFYTEFIQADVQAFITDVEYGLVTQGPTDQADNIYVRTTADTDFEDIIPLIAGYRSDIKVKSWQEVSGIVGSMTISFAVIQAILTVINMLVAGITVFIVTYIDLSNKRRQIGIERAIGITPVSIVTSYVFRAIFYALLAAFLSWLFYKFVAVPLEARYPFRFPYGEVMLFTSPRLFTRAALIILGVAIVSSFLPARRTTRQKLLDAIWG